MKKTWILLAISIAALASCAKMQNPDPVGDEETVATKTVTFAATVEQDDSKATISSSSNFTWQSSDRVAVVTAKGKKVTLGPTDIDGGSATFTATIDADDSTACQRMVVHFWTRVLPCTLVR